MRRTPDVSCVPGSGSPSDSPPVPPSVDPPCAAYPTFDLSRLSKHEQHIVEALVAEIADAIAFPGAEE
ncbi:hypothetical protein DQ04_00741210 [Trypanosoma grayi]|uniref:hypothetical protein n=1 Tax=Trypanosoma grayi TaxID=71804 RepID=UPI0004F4AAFF|nr:hypothetical protein DQ04_00741210 [Trypanosoma grayi]KEG13877.1 hypothetical protein DQ04_00741210 [Trypanosoma grayi]